MGDENITALTEEVRLVREELAKLVSVQQRNYRVAAAANLVGMITAMIFVGVVLAIFILSVFWAP